MKKGIRATVLCAALILAIAGCGSYAGGARRVSGPEDEGSGTASGPEYDIAEQLKRHAERDVDLPQLSKKSDLQDYLIYAALNNPGLRAAFEEWKAALQKVPQVTALPDPQLTFGYFIQEIETRVGPQEWRAGLMQKFPWFGKLDLKGDMAGKAARAAWERFEARRLKLYHEVKAAYAEYYYLSRAIEITRETRSLVDRLEDVARVKYKTGIATHADVIKAQVELGKLQDRLESLRDLKEPRAAKLNAALGRPAEVPLPWPVDLEHEEVALRQKKLLAELKEQNPQLKALRWNVERAESGVDLAGLRYYPDVTAGLTYIETGSAVMPGVGDSGKDPVLASLSINLPLWWNSYRAGEREARARLRQARRSLDDKANELESELKLAVYGVQDARRKIDLYANTLVPQARQSMKATQTAFQAGDADFLSLLDAERILLEFQLAHQRAVADHLESTAMLEMLVGRQMGREAPQATGDMEDNN